MKQQKGFVLVSVLIITTITTMIAFSQIKENRLQERIGGNQQKEINARLLAEKGIIDAFEDIAEKNAASVSNANILTYLKDSSNFPQTNVNCYYSFPETDIELDAINNTFTFVSQGSCYGAVAYLKTQIEAIEVSSSSLFNDAVVGCDGVTIGNGLINSYDSTVAPYDSGTANENGSVTTIKSEADIELSGSGSVYGNVISNGSISTGVGSASTIVGDLTAANNIQLKGIDTAADIHAGGDFSYKNLDATGESITVGGDINGSGSNNITSSVSYGGTDSTGYFGLASTGIVAPDTYFGECDPLSIPTVMTDLGTAMINATATATDFSTLTGSTVNFSESSVTSSDGISASPVPLSLLEGSVSSGTSDIFDEAASVYSFGAADLTGQTLNISGDITIFVDGNITTSNTTFTLADSSSSLTILTSGQIDMGPNTTTVDAAGVQISVDSDGEVPKVPLTIYSSYTSDPDVDADEDLALTVTSNADIYAKVYAPLGNVSLTGGGNIMGAVRGGNVTFNSSAGQIHYDEALADIDDIEDEDTKPASYSAVYYYYPA